MQCRDERWWKRPIKEEESEIVFCFCKSLAYQSILFVIGLLPTIHFSSDRNLCVFVCPFVHYLRSLILFCSCLTERVLCTVDFFPPVSFWTIVSNVVSIQKWFYNCIICLLVSFPLSTAFPFSSASFFFFCFVFVLFWFSPFEPVLNEVCSTNIQFTEEDKSAFLQMPPKIASHVTKEVEQNRWPTVASIKQAHHTPQAKINPLTLPPSITNATILCVSKLAPSDQLSHDKRLDRSFGS